MENLIKAIVGLKLVGLVLFFIVVLISIVYTTFTEAPPRPDEQTWVCNDGDVQPPGLYREGCLHHGGLDHWEDRRK